MSLINTKVKLGNTPGLYEDLVAAILKDPRYKGTTKAQIDEYMQRVKWHESSVLNINQKGGGPAAGYYQIEKNSMPYAYKGLNDMLGKDYAPWYDDIKKADPNTQAAYSLAHDWMQAKGDKKVIDFSKPMDAWLNYHWRGKASDRQARINSWTEKMKTYKGVVATKPVSVNISPVQTGGLIEKPKSIIAVPTKGSAVQKPVQASNSLLKYKSALMGSILKGYNEMSDFIDRGLEAMAPK